jgi:nicotinamide-nucleotide amidase
MTDAVELVELLKDARATVATAESLTGGRLAARMSEAPGSSEIFLGGAVTYATEAKVKVLGVPEQVVEEHGVVSGECARAMAEGVRRLLGSTYGVSTTGVAGPDRQEGHPAGTVWVAVAGPSGATALLLGLDGDRAAIRWATCDAALELIADQLGS